MKYKKGLIVLILSLVYCQSFSQIVKLNKGQLFPFDTGVAMDLNLYRSIRFKSIECDSFINVSQKETILKDSIIVSQNKTIEIQQNYIDKNKFITKKAPYLILFSFIIGILI